MLHNDGNIQQPLQKKDEVQEQQNNLNVQEQQNNLNVQEQQNEFNLNEEIQNHLKTLTSQENVKTKNEDYFEHMERVYKEFWAAHPVPEKVAPVEHPPKEAHLSRKQRNKLEKKRKATLKKGLAITPYADLYTAKLSDDFKLNNYYEGNRINIVQIVSNLHPEQKELDRETKQIVKAFLPSFQLNKKSKPVKTVDKENAQRGKQLAENYICGDRVDFLNNAVEEVTKMRFNSEMFKPAYIREHFVEMKELDSKLNMLNFIEKNNSDYFKALPKETLDLWNITKNFFNVCSVWITNTLAISGMDTSGCRLRVERKDLIPEKDYNILREQHEEGIQMSLNMWEKALRAYQGTHGKE